VTTAVPADTSADAVLRKIRWWLCLFMAGLVFSGVTAIPLESELKLLTRITAALGLTGIGLQTWLVRVLDGLEVTNARYPFIAYGTDWLAFAHVVIAVAFIGPWRDPVRNRWVIEFGMIACVLVAPFALFMGGWRGIPIGWRLIDCSFGIFGFVPLWLCRREILRLEKLRVLGV